MLKAIQEQERISLMLMKRQKDDKKEELGPQFKFIKRTHAAMDRDRQDKEEDPRAAKQQKFNWEPNYKQIIINFRILNGILIFIINAV